MKNNTNIAIPSFGLFDYCWLFHPVRFFKDLSIYHLRIKKATRQTNVGLLFM